MTDDYASAELNGIAMTLGLPKGAHIDSIVLAIGKLIGERDELKRTLEAIHDRSTTAAQDIASARRERDRARDENESLRRSLRDKDYERRVAVADLADEKMNTRDLARVIARMRTAEVEDD